MGLPTVRHRGQGDGNQDRLLRSYGLTGPALHTNVIISQTFPAESANHADETILNYSVIAIRCKRLIACPLADRVLQHTLTQKLPP
jgi:hypothetical protein